MNQTWVVQDRSSELYYEALYGHYLDVSHKAIHCNPFKKHISQNYIVQL